MATKALPKIKVSPEGRKDVWLVKDKKSLIAYIKAKKLKKIHNFISGNIPVILGADHDVESVLEDIKAGERIAVFTDPHFNMGHSLAIADEELEAYEIGPITVDNLEIV